MAANMSQLYLCMGRPSNCLRISKAIRRWAPRAMSCTACSGATAAHLPSDPPRDADRIFIGSYQFGRGRPARTH
eukprot:8686422-Pyramimonas_sp.AAC.1